MIRIAALLLFSQCLIVSCKQTAGSSVHDTSIQEATASWKNKFDAALPLLGHRNWIIVADKAFPRQNGTGIEYINTNENLLSVLGYVLRQVNASGHVKPVIYTDKELSFITEAQSKGINDFALQSKKLFAGQPVQTLLHDSVFTKLDAASKLFSVLVLKTNETLPYTSVFLQLDCAYWNAEKEAALRNEMNK